MREFMRAAMILAISAAPALADSPTVSVNPASVGPGAAVAITINGGPGNKADWVSIGPAGAPLQTYSAWGYLNGLQQQPGAGLKTTTVNLKAPVQTGDYDVRFLQNNQFILLAKTSFSVVGQTCAAGQFLVSINPFTCATGASGPPGPPGPAFVPSQAFGTPTSATMPCQRGASLFDAKHAYLCTAPDTWLSVPLNAFSNQ